MMSGYGAGMFGLGGWLMMLGWVALIVGVVLVVAWALGKADSRTPDAGVTTRPNADAVEVLRLRFARGEITVDEYMAAKQTLEADR